MGFLWPKLRTAVETTKYLLDGHKEEMAEVEGVGVDTSFILVLKYFMSKTDLIGFLIIFSEDENEADDDSDKSTDIREIVIDFIELAVVDGRLGWFSEIEF